MSKKPLLVLLLLALVIVAPSFAADPENDAPKEDVIVLFDSNQNKNVEAVAGHGKVTGSTDIVPAVFATVPANAKPALEKMDHVVAVERDAEVELVKKPPWAGGPGGGNDDTQQPSQETPWGIDRINGTEAATSVNEGNVDVAILDTGIDYEHPDLDANVELGVSTTGNGPLKEGLKFAKDKNGHGTHVAGTVAAENNSIGVIGTAPNADLYAVKVLGNDGSGTYSDIIQGIEWAVNNDAEIISMSFGGTQDSQALQNALNNAGVIPIAAAGNSGDGDQSTNEVTYPAKYPNVTAVAATNPTDTTPTWSSEGSEVEVSAPGVNVKSTWLDGNYETLDGTSMATPHTSGTAALILAHNGSLTPNEVRKVLHNNCIDIENDGTDNYSGHGLIQADNSVATE